MVVLVLSPVPDAAPLAATWEGRLVQKANFLPHLEQTT